MNELTQQAMKNDLYARSVLVARMKNAFTYRIFHFESFRSLQYVWRVRNQHFLGFDAVVW